MKYLFTFSFILFAAMQIFAQSGLADQGYRTHSDIRAIENKFDCFSVIAGKKATIDGSVLLAHNEDDAGEQMLNIYITEHEKENDIAKYIWVEFPGMEAADSFLNEYGVAIASDYCASREDKPELTEGGILYELRVNAAKYARSAKHAVKLMGELIEKYGYGGVGRSYLLADCNEGWILSAVNGKHWVAARVPDDCVMIIPNNYVIDKVDLSDTLNYLGSKDIVSYAIERGWYDPQKDGAFSFRKAYRSPTSHTSKRNFIRHLSAIQYFTGKEHDENPDTFEFAFVPKRKVAMQDMINVLTSHGENTIYKESIYNVKPEHHPNCICVNTTVSAAIFQLRSGMPVEIGAVMWLAAYHPCTTVFIPWYLGMDKAPDGFARYDSYKKAIDLHFENKNLRQNNPDAIYWKFIDNFNEIDKDYHSNINEVKNKNSVIQNNLFSNQKKFEKELLKKLKSGTQISNILNRYTESLYETR